MFNPWFCSNLEPNRFPDDSRMMLVLSSPCLRVLSKLWRSKISWTSRGNSSLVIPWSISLPRSHRCSHVMMINVKDTASRGIKLSSMIWRTHWWSCGESNGYYSTSTLFLPFKQKSSRSICSYLHVWQRSCRLTFWGKMPWLPETQTPPTSQFVCKSMQKLLPIIATPQSKEGFSRVIPSSQRGIEMSVGLVSTTFV